MTAITDDIDAITGGSFGATDVTAAVVAATNIVDGYTDDTFSIGVIPKLDTAVVLLAVEILKRGKQHQFRRTQPSDAEIWSVMNPQILSILRTSESGSYTLFTDITPTSNSTWRS